MRKPTTVIAVCAQETEEEGSALKLDERLSERQLKLLSQAFAADTLVSALSVPDVAVRLFFTDSAESRQSVSTMVKYLESRADKGSGALAHGRFETLALPDELWGDKIGGAFQACFNEGFTKVVFIGSRTPTLTADMLKQAIDALDTYGVISGPTIEGRFYLLGMRGKMNVDLSAYDWANSAIYSQLSDSFTAAGLNWTELPLWYCVENPDDLEYLVRDINQYRLEGDELTAHETEKALQRILPELEREPA